MITDGSGIGRQKKAEPSPFDAIGKPIGAENREYANAELKRMGVESSGSRWDCVQMVAEKLERDNPHEAMKIAMRYVDVTGAYRLFAALLADISKQEESGGK